MRAHVLQTLTENPDLIPELRSLLTGTTGRRLPTAAPASSGGTPVLQGESTSTGSRVQGRMEPERLHAHPGEDLGQMYDMDDVDEENDHGNPYVNCRMH